MSDLYNRQEKLKLNKDQSITVVGCGGIGFWVCKFAAMSGIDRIYAFDDDVIDETNLNRLDLPVSFIGKNKAETVKQIITHLRPNCTFFSMPFKYNGQETKTDWLIDCTDRLKTQEKNQEFAKKNGMEYFKAGYDGESFSIHNKVAEWGDIEDEGYIIVPSWVVPATLVAALSVAKIMKYYDAEFASTIPNLLKGKF